MGICNDTYGQGTYIKAKELGDDDVEVQIAGVTMEESFGREQVTLTIGEGDDARKLSLNKTNCNVLSDNFGDADSIEELDRLWTGKSIILYAIDTQTPDGVATRGLRVRVKKAARVGLGKPATTAETPV